MFPYSCACLIFWVWVCLLYSLHVSLVWPFKGKAKDREAKERQLNGHQFATGSCLGPTVCLICEKPASGRDLLHCSSRSPSFSHVHNPNHTAGGMSWDL